MIFIMPIAIRCLIVWLKSMMLYLTQLEKIQTDMDRLVCQKQTGRLRFKMMNERIKSLLNVCGMPNEELMDIYTDANKTFYMKKFAELVIKECITEIKARSLNSGDEWEQGLIIAADAIKEHFGVE